MIALLPKFRRCEQYYSWTYNGMGLKRYVKQ